MSRSLKIVSGLGLMVLCILFGLIIPTFSVWAGDNLIRALVLPAALFLVAIFVFDKISLLLLILLFRASIEDILEATRFGSMTFGAVLNGLIILISLLMFFERPKTLYRTVIPMWWPLMLIALFEMLRAPDPSAGLKWFMAFISYMAVFSAPFYLKQSKEGMYFCIKLILISSLIPAIYGFVDFHAGGMGGAYGNRISSTFSHANIFAPYLVLVITLILYLIKSPLIIISRPKKWVLVFYMFVLLVLLVLTQTRSAWAACIVVFAIYGLLFERKFLIYMLMVAAIALLIPSIQDRLLDLNSSNQYVSTGKQNSYEWRTNLWGLAIGWMQIKDYAFGYGLGSFPYYSTYFYREGNGINWSAHSVYVQWLFEAGIAGLSCSAWLFYRLFQTLRLRIKKDRLGTVLMMTVVVEYLVVSYSDNMLDYLSFNWYFWFVMGSACALSVAGESQEALAGKITKSNDRNTQNQFQKNQFSQPN